MSTSTCNRLLSITRRIIMQNRKYGGGGKFVEPHMNELPVPQGSWKQSYDAKQKSYNLILGAGIVAFTATATIFTQSGVIFFNFYPPDSIE